MKPQIDKTNSQLNANNISANSADENRDTNMNKQPISDDIQLILDDYLGVPTDLQDLISGYLSDKSKRKKKRKSSTK